MFAMEDLFAVTYPTIGARRRAEVTAIAILSHVVFVATTRETQH